MSGYHNRFLEMVLISNDNDDGDAIYPPRMGEKWTDKEKELLLQELDDNIDVETIARNHGRTIGGINSRRDMIAYEMYLNNKPIEEIIKITKLSYGNIMKIIEKKSNQTNKLNKYHRSNVSKNKTGDFISINKTHYIELQNDVKQMKININEIKTTLNDLVEMMKAVYIFEDVEN